MTRKKKSQKPSELLSIYSKRLTIGIETKHSLLAFDIVLQNKSPHIARISGYLIFRTGWILEFDEILQQEKDKITKMKYRYHFMDKSKELIFRYDNVAHFPKIKTYPHHKHLKNKVAESKAPDLINVIDEIEFSIIKEKLN